MFFISNIAAENAPPVNALSFRGYHIVQAHITSERQNPGELINFGASQFLHHRTGAGAILRLRRDVYPALVKLADQKPSLILEAGPLSAPLNNTVDRYALGKLDASGSEKRWTTLGSKPRGSEFVD